MKNYLHGYSVEESIRLNAQANAVEQFIHYDSHWEPGSLVLEAGCGVGAQTKTIAQQNPKTTFLSVDISESSLGKAQQVISDLKIENVRFQQADILDLPFEDDYFDHLFLCFVLEHLPNPVDVLIQLKRVLKTNGTITVVEGDHGSTYFHPESSFARKAIDCQVQLQRFSGGDAEIGRKLYPLLEQAAFTDIRVSPRQIYVDDSKPSLVSEFTLNTFTAMIKGVAKESIKKGLITEIEMKKGIGDLEKTASGGGTFCYTFFKAIGKKV